MIQIVIEHKTAQPTSYNPCFLCITCALAMLVCVSLAGFAFAISGWICKDEDEVTLMFEMCSIDLPSA
ncbi:Uncharacterized protein HZ326_1298 [Fusarium oxysporum f. sp. albedinis]|nr:Uncharacterized protein HZ326_1298 [Fusarium oxysporum f. sp. albedinis]